MAEPQSNNPYRRSMSPTPPAESSALPPAASASTAESLSAPSHPLSKSYSSTTTIAEEPEPEDDHHRGRSLYTTNANGTTTVPYPTNLSSSRASSTVSLSPDSNISKEIIITEPKTPCSRDSIVITIHPTSSASSCIPPHPTLPCTAAKPTNPRASLSHGRPSMSTHPHPRHSMQLDGLQQCEVWPARRFAQKQRNHSKRRLIIIKVVCVVLFFGAAVAIGMGVSKAVRNANRNGDTRS